MGWKICIVAARLLGLAMAVPAWALTCSAADPVASNVTVAQRPGTKLVDIGYDLAADGDVDISVTISADGGTTWTLPATSLTGAMGTGVVAGTGKVIVWDGGADWPWGHTAQGRVQITASVPEFVLIPAGTNSGTNLLAPEESWNIHYSQNYSLTVGSFYMGRTEVTKEKWDTVRVWGLENGYTDLPAGGSKGQSHPVHSVNWYDCVKWCNAHSEMEERTPCYTVSDSVYKTGESDSVACAASASGYRLPTDTEWEYAARGGLSGRRFPWNNNITHSQANYRSTSACSYDLSPTRDYHPDCDDGEKPYTSPVGSFAANNYGLHDMAGNVDEWNWDWKPGYVGSGRETHGGSWASYADWCRSANSPGYAPRACTNYRGFRVCSPALGRVAGLAQRQMHSAQSGVVSLDFRDYTLTVASAHATPTPAVGPHTYAWHATVTCTVADDSATHDPTGWTGAGSVPATGPALTTGALLLDEVGGSTASSITWDWQETTYALIVENGTGDGEYPPGTEVDTVADAAAPGKRFAGWTANPPEHGVELAEAAEESTAFTMPAAAVTLTANYAAKTYTVTFDLGAHGTRAGGGALTQSIIHGSQAWAPEFTVEVGWRSAGWDVAFESVTTDLTVTAQYAEEDAPYLVIDLSPGPSAGSYPFSYLDTIPGGGWTEEHKTTKLVLRRVPAGTFVMGSPVSELGRNTNETLHQVTISQSFYIGVFEVTQRQWGLVMDSWPSYFANEAFRDLRPVEQVSFDDIRGDLSGSDWPASTAVDASSFMGRLRQRTGLEALDLPTESQWEYACRAGTGTAFNNGKGITDIDTCPNLAEVGRYRYNTGFVFSSDSDFGAGTAAAGSYLPNAWGLYDMHGNAWEWCLDWYGLYPGTTTTDPRGPTSAIGRTTRGGCWYFAARTCRAGHRGSDIPTSEQHNYLGFRLTSGLSEPLAIAHTVTFDLGAHGTRAGGGALTQSIIHGSQAWAPEFTVEVGWRSAGWDVAFESVTTDLTVTAQYAEEDAPYLVIDLSPGPSAGSYPFSYLDTIPGGGWTEEHKTTKLVLRRVPAGTFVMGSPVSELGRNTNETLHQVTISQSFYIGVFEVTQRQWGLVMDSWPSYFANEAFRDLRPVEQVSFDDIRGDLSGSDWPASTAVDASSFMGRLRQKTGVDFDLPTESQWEYACRAKTTTALDSGKNLTDTTTCPNMAEVGRYWYNGGSGFTQGGDLSVGTAVVGSYLPNAWGLYDMHGNVWEWCLDRYGSYPGTVTDPGGDVGGSLRVARGGSWFSWSWYCRSANRDGYSPSFRYDSLCFRLVGPLSLPPAVTHVVTFDLGFHSTRIGGGDPVQSVVHGSSAWAPTFAAGDGWAFTGWDAPFESVSADLTVTAQYNATPEAVEDSYSTPEDTALAVIAPGVLTNDTDAEEDDLIAVKLTDPVHGVVTLQADGSFVYTPAEDYSGSDSFTYKANDGDGDSAPATVTLTVSPTNDPPVNTVLPTVTGTTTVGSVLTADKGTWNDAIDTTPGTLSYAYQWRRADDGAGTNAADIAGATSATYTLQSDDAGTYVAVRITAKDDGEGTPASQSLAADSTCMAVTHWSFSPGNTAEAVWNICLESATLDGAALTEKDEIAVYQADRLVGWTVLTGPLVGGMDVHVKAYAELADGSTGYVSGQPYELRCWNASAGTESTGFYVAYPFPGGGYEGTTFPVGTSVDSVMDLIFSSVGPGLMLTESDGITAVTEGGTADSVTIRLAAPPTDTMTVTVAFSPDTEFATERSGTTTLTFTAANWAAYQSLSIRAVDDGIIEGPETTTIQLVAGGGGYDDISATVDVTVTDNDEATVAFSVLTARAGENAEHEIVAVLALPAGKTLGIDLTADLVRTGGTAAAGIDYVDWIGQIQTLAFPAGSVSGDTASAALNILADLVLEPDETVVFALANPSAALAIIEPATHTVMIDEYAGADAWLWVLNGVSCEFSSYSFGMHPDALDGDLLDDLDLPHPFGLPEEKNAICCFVEDFANPTAGTRQRDVRAAKRTGDVWQLTVLPPLTGAASLNWTVPAGFSMDWTISLVEVEADGTPVVDGVSLDMRVANELPIAADPVGTDRLFQIVAVGPPDVFDLTLEPGWNLVSLPIEPYDPDTASIFNDDRIFVRRSGTSLRDSLSRTMVHSGTVWIWGDSEEDGVYRYEATTQLHAGQGAWVFLDETEPVTLRVGGNRVANPEVLLHYGWNLVGTGTAESSVPGDAPVRDAVFLWIPQTLRYLIVDLLSPGYGHWLCCTAASYTLPLANE